MTVGVIFHRCNPKQRICVAWPSKLSAHHSSWHKWYILDKKIVIFSTRQRTSVRDTMSFMVIYCMLLLFRAGKARLVAGWTTCPPNHNLYNLAKQIKHYIMITIICNNWGPLLCLAMELFISGLGWSTSKYTSSTSAPFSENTLQSSL